MSGTCICWCDVTDRMNDKPVLDMLDIMDRSPKLYHKVVFVVIGCGARLSFLLSFLSSPFLSPNHRRIQ